MSRFKNYYLEEFTFFKERILYIFIGLLSVFIIGHFLGYFAYHYYLSHPNAILNILIAAADQSMKELVGWVRQFRGFLFVAIFLYNLRSSLLMTAFGVIPFLFLSGLMAFTTSFFLGLILSKLKIMGGISILSILVTTVPHGIFEIPAVIYSVCIGMFITFEITKKILPGYRKDSLSFLHLLKKVLFSYLLVIIPLLLIAAIIESYVTPVIYFALKPWL